MSRCVMIIEDDVEIREMIMLVLRAEGYEIATAAEGAEALEKLRAGVQPCVILLDLMMPGVNGWQFHAELMADPRLAHIPVVVVSGASNVAESAKALGAAGYLAKPVSLEALIDGVTRCRLRDDGS